MALRAGRSLTLRATRGAGREPSCRRWRATRATARVSARRRPTRSRRSSRCWRSWNCASPRCSFIRGSPGRARRAAGERRAPDPCPTRMRRRSSIRRARPATPRGAVLTRGTVASAAASAANLGWQRRRLLALVHAARARGRPVDPDPQPRGAPRRRARRRLRRRRVPGSRTHASRSLAGADDARARARRASGLDAARAPARGARRRRGARRSCCARAARRGADRPHLRADRDLLAGRRDALRRPLAPAACGAGAADRCRTCACATGASRCAGRR